MIKGFLIYIKVLIHCDNLVEINNFITIFYAYFLRRRSVIDGLNWGCQTYWHSLVIQLKGQFGTVVPERYLLTLLLTKSKSNKLLDKGIFAIFIHRFVFFMTISKFMSFFIGLKWTIWFFAGRLQFRIIWFRQFWIVNWTISWSVHFKEKFWPYWKSNAR